MNPPVFRLPNELICAVVQLLNIEDAFQLGLSCRHFQSVLRGNSVCRILMEIKAPFSPECIKLRESWQYRRALYILAKRKLALSQLQPFSAAVVAVADSYLYVNGSLLYFIDRSLRILGLRGTVRFEKVVDIRLLLNGAVPESEGTTKYKISLLHYASGIVTCRYTHCRLANESWLVVFNPYRKWACSQRLPSSHKIFARSTRDYVIFGTHTGQGHDGFRRWILRRYSIRQRCVVGTSLCLEGVIGCDIGNDVCFEIIDNYFYALSNQSSYADTSEDSFYYCCRFPLDDPERIEVAAKSSLWRRHNVEGTIDDRWTFLRLEKSETTGAITIIESRKEWRFNRDARRTYYIQQPLFPQRVSRPSCASASAHTAHGSSHSESFWSASGSGSGSGSNDLFENRGVSGHGNSAGEHMSDTSEDLYSDSLDGDVDSADDEESSSDAHPRHHPHRFPENVHPGDDASRMILFTLSACFIRSYFLTCATFLDLVNSPTASKPNEQRLLLRAGCRTPRAETAPCCGPAAQTRDSHSHDGHDHDCKNKQDDLLYPLRGINRLFHAQDIVTWPPDPPAPCAITPGENAEGHDAQQAQDNRFWKLQEIVNPPNHQGNVHGTWDDRSLVYATGGSAATADGGPSLQALVFINFDPSTCLPGLSRWQGGLVPERGAGQDAQGDPEAEAGGPAGSVVLNSYGDEDDSEDADREDGVHGPPHLASSGSPCAGTEFVSLAPDEKERTVDWVSTEAPLYRVIDNGFDFCY